MVVLWIKFPFSYDLFYNVSDKGSRRWSFWHDFKLLWKATSFQVTMWSLKDATEALHNWTTCGVVNCPSQSTWVPTSVDEFWFNTYSSDEISRTWAVLGLNFVVFAVILVVALLHHAFWKWYSNRNDKAGVGSAAWLEANSPFGLGIAVQMSHFGDFLWYFFPSDWVRTYHSGADKQHFAFAMFVRTCSLLLMTFIAVRGTVWYRSGPKKETYDSISFAWARRRGIDLIADALPLAAAYQAVNWCYQVFFEGFFKCRNPYSGCAEHRDLWLWVLYSVLFTVLTFYLAPRARAASYMTRVSEALSATVLKSDRYLLQRSEILDDLLISFGGIGAGYAYAATARAECRENATPTCPKGDSFLDIFYYLVSVALLILFTTVWFHIFMKGQRLTSRVAKVTALEDGNTQALFSELEDAGDGMLSKDQLSEYLEQSGLDPDFFLVAFDNLVSPSETLVSQEALLKEVSRLINTLQDTADDSLSSERTMSMLADTMFTEMTTEMTTEKTNLWSKNSPPEMELAKRLPQNDDDAYLLWDDDRK
eukprot:TRINITY_DN7034_c0_g1_i1.p1 TRINITY_DN7034_c0_g1~~TRINITY_DN7034_c0_g1_i1.p1  ORF type:complete len:536 (-),score=72.97 TRINITY_DN7034_c0_g1_i1:178-1785(-)